MPSPLYTPYPQIYYPEKHQYHKKKREFIKQSTLNGLKIGTAIGIISSGITLLMGTKDYKKSFHKEVKFAKESYQRGLKKLKDNPSIQKSTYLTEQYKKSYQKSLKSKPALKQQLKVDLSRSKEVLADTTKTNFKKVACIGLGLSILKGCFLGWSGAKARLTSEKKNPLASKKQHEKDFKKSILKTAFLLGGIEAAFQLRKEIGIYLKKTKQTSCTPFTRFVINSTIVSTTISSILWAAVGIHATKKADKNLR